MEYITMIWKISTLLYAVLSMVESQMHDGYQGHKSPVLDQTTKMIVLLEGETAVFPCVGTNMEDSLITWFKDSISTIIAANGRLVIFDEERFSIEPISTTGQENLKITNVTTNDTNVYTCMLNTFPPQMRDIQLTVKAPPKIEKSNMIQRYQYTQGDSLEIVCKVQGAPTPQVQWYFYKPKTDQQPETRDLVSTNDRLTLRNLNMANEGIYRCEAENEVGKDMYEIFLEEVYKPKLDTPMKKTVVKLSSTAKLHCEVESNPTASIHWQRNEKLLEESWKYVIQLYAESENKIISVLNIVNSEYADNGLYLCIARNDLGRDNIKLYLTVEDPSVTTTTEVSATTTKTTSKSRTTTIEYSEKKTPDNLVITAAPETVKENPRTDASRNTGTEPHGNYLIGLLLSVLMKYLVL